MEARKYIHLKEYYIEGISDRFRGSVYEFYAAICDDPDDVYNVDIEDLHTVYNGEIDKMPDFNDEEWDEYQEVVSRERDFFKEGNDDDWNSCWKESEEEEFDVALKKILKDYCKKSK